MNVVDAVSIFVQWADNGVIVATHGFDFKLRDGKFYSPNILYTDDAKFWVTGPDLQMVPTGTGRLYVCIHPDIPQQDDNWTSDKLKFSLDQMQVTERQRTWIDRTPFENFTCTSMNVRMAHSNKIRSSMIFCNNIEEWANRSFDNDIAYVPGKEQFKEVAITHQSDENAIMAFYFMGMTAKTKVFE